MYVVDDDRELLSSLVELSLAGGFKAIGLTSLDELLSLSPFPSPSCVLADVFLENTTTLDLPDQLRSMNADLPVLFMTASDDQAVLRRADRAGAGRCLRKPFERDELFDALDAALSGQARQGHRPGPTMNPVRFQPLNPPPSKRINSDEDK